MSRIQRGLVIAACCFCAAVGLVFLSSVIRTEEDPWESALLVFAGLTFLVGVLATALWTSQWHALGRTDTFRFLGGPRPPNVNEVAAWRWGRLALLAWLLVLAAMATYAVMVYWDDVPSVVEGRR